MLGKLYTRDRDDDSSGSFEHAPTTTVMTPDLSTLLEEDEYNASSMSLAVPTPTLVGSSSQKEQMTCRPVETTTMDTVSSTLSLSSPPVSPKRQKSNNTTGTTSAISNSNKHKKFISTEEFCNLIAISPSPKGVRQSVPSSSILSAVPPSPMEEKERRVTTPADELRRFVLGASAVAAMRSHSTALSTTELESNSVDGGGGGGIPNSTTPLRRMSRKSGSPQGNNSQRYGGTCTTGTTEENGRTLSADDAIIKMLKEISSKSSKWKSDTRINAGPERRSDTRINSDPERRSDTRINSGPERKSSGEHGSLLRQNALKLILLNRMQPSENKLRSSGNEGKLRTSIKSSSTKIFTTAADAAEATAAVNDDKKNDAEKGNESCDDDDGVSSIGDDDDEYYDDDDNVEQEDAEAEYKKSDEYVVAYRTKQATWGCVGMLVVLTFISGLLIGTLAPKQESKEMEPAFEHVVDKLFHHVGRVGSQNVRAMSLLSSSLTSYSLLVSKANNDSNNSNTLYEGIWPFVTDPHYHVNSKQTASLLSGSDASTTNIMTLPIVTIDQQDLWSEYSTDRNTVLQYRTKGAVEMSTMMYTIDPTTGTRMNASSSSSSIFYPIWQVSPSNNITIHDVNFDVNSISSFGSSIHTSIDSRKAVVSTYIPANNTEAQISTHIAMLNATTTSTTNGPYSLLAVPIFASFFDQLTSVESQQQPTATPATTSSKNDDHRTVVGTVSTPFVWKSYFENAFHNGAVTGIVVVLDGSSCDTGVNNNNHNTNKPSLVHTFVITGDTVVYEGAGDLHETSFTSYKRTAVFNKLVNEHIRLSSSQGQQEDYTTNLNEIYCPYILSVYPSAEFQEQFVSNLPTVFTATTVMVWVFCITVFILYGSYVQLQIRLLYEKAAYNRFIVNTLFPLGVQERMRQVQEAQAEANKQQQQYGKNGNQQQQQSTTDNNNETTIVFSNSKNGTPAVSDDDEDDILAGVGGTGGQVVGGGNGNGSSIYNNQFMNDTPPIADLFPAATVMFADIAGFTAWSSERNPVEVFTLLETLYNSFDTLANRKRVFKVETIGDCYMCVTGLPEERDDHAVAMATFSYLCLRQSRRVVRQLAAKLGNDVLNLTVRVGMNSGPVTAGVLRGEKARFQLFGDTVNTASRMESTGEKGRIQLSETTANELKRYGNESWIAPRPGGVAAKGKGTVQTYWLLPTAMKQQTKSNDSSHGTSKTLTRGGIVGISEENLFADD